MRAMGIIFSDPSNETMEKLVERRTLASVPFGGRYRLIDFALSNMVNAEISNISVIAKRNYQSLMDHIGSGKDWDLSRRHGGIAIFPPFGNYKSDTLFGNRIEALKSIMGFVNKSHEEQVLLMDCDSVNVIDYAKVLDQHEATKADITVIYKEGTVTKDLQNHVSLTMNEEKRITNASLLSVVGNKSNIAINAWVINRRLLNNLVDDALAHGATNFERDIILRNVKQLRIFGYQYEGIYLHINSMENYFANNMHLLDASVRDQLFGQKDLAIYTKVRDSAPTKYGFNAKVENSFIADGCIIEGTVENSILFRGVKIGKNTVIKNSILMQDTITGDNVILDYVITDKNVTIRDRNRLAGCAKIPYFLGKNVMV